MLFKSTLLAAILLLSANLFATRDLEYITDVKPDNQSVVLNGRVIIFGHTDAFLSAFSDDEGIRNYSFPFIGSTRPRYYTQFKPVVYNSQVYFVAHHETGYVFFRFNGSTISRIALASNIVTSPVVFGSYIYFMGLGDGAANAQLYRYDGITTTSVEGTIPATRSYHLKVAGGYLYLIGKGYYASEPYTVKRYNGTTFTTLPHFTFFNGISDIHAVGVNAYIMLSSSKILYYNGTSISTVYDSPGAYVHATLWRGELYYLGTSSAYAEAVPLTRVNAGIRTQITMPAGTRIWPNSDITTYNDALYFMANYSGTDNRVLRYNTAGFSTFFNIPASVTHAGYVFERQGNLVIQPEQLSETSSWEYNGSTFEELRVPAGQYFAEYINSTDCNHLWSSMYYDEEDIADPYRWGLLKESKGCPPPETSPSLPIPKHFMDFERADLKMWGKDRGWCWNEIIIDWEIEPCEFPDCPDISFSAGMFKGKDMAWENQFTKPSTLKIPLEDVQPYSAKIANATGQKEDLFVFTDNLVEKGIESISISMKPGDGFFKIEATTDKNVKQDIRIELLGKNGEVLWQKDFQAPFAEQIFDKIKEPGQTLRFSIPGSKQSKSIITDLNIYPNPSKGVLNLQVKSAKETIDAELSISTLLGQRILNRKIRVPFNQQIQLNDIKPGIYVVKIISGKEVMSKIIKVD